MMSNPVDGLAKEQVAHQPVAVRTDDQEVHRIAPQMSNELAGGIGTVEQHRACLMSTTLQRYDQLGEIASVPAGFTVGGKSAVNEGDRGIDHVQEHKLGIAAIDPG